MEVCNPEKLVTVALTVPALTLGATLNSVVSKKINRRPMSFTHHLPVMALAGLLQMVYRAVRIQATRAAEVWATAAVAGRRSFPPKRLTVQALTTRLTAAGVIGVALFVPKTLLSAQLLEVAQHAFTLLKRCSESRHTINKPKPICGHGF